MNSKLDSTYVTRVWDRLYVLLA